MGNITMEENRSVEGNLAVFADRDGINIKDGGVTLLNNGNGDEFLSNNGTYKSAFQKSESYLVDFISPGFGYIKLDTVPPPSYMAPFGVLMTSPAGSPATNLSTNGWVLEPGDYMVAIQMYIRWDAGGGGAHNVLGDNIIVLPDQLDLTVDSIEPARIAVPYQGETTSDIHFSPFMMFPLPGVGASNQVRINVTVEGGSSPNFYELISANANLLQSTITFTKIS
ncbi:hypothetical protein [Flavobacterium sp.]|uniref:hypothetical protein n=1 Tax=Flavobacterium sp. TaxID=239 RepID=UPI003F696957